MLSRLRNKPQYDACHMAEHPDLCKLKPRIVSTGIRRLVPLFKAVDESYCSSLNEIE
jgi:hypothetical protein